MATQGSHRILQVCPGLLSPLFSLSVCSPLFWSWQIYSGRRQPPPATHLLTHGICQVRTTCRLPKFGTVAETCPLSLFIPSPQELNNENLCLLVPLVPTLLHLQVVLLEAVVPWPHPHHSAFLCALHCSILPQFPFFSRYETQSGAGGLCLDRCSGSLGASPRPWWGAPLPGQLLIPANLCWALGLSPQHRCSL